MLNVLVLIMSAVSALLSGLAAIYGERLIGEGFSSIVIIGAIFAISGTVFFLLMIITNSLQSRKTAYSFAASRKKVIAISCLAIVVLFGMGVLFEYLYEITPKVQVHEVEDVVFLMDRSGSMSSTDPNSDSKRALREFVRDHNHDAEIMLIEFADEGKEVMPFTENSVESYDQIVAAIDSLSDPDGATVIESALQLAQAGITGRADQSNNVDVVIVSDGEIHDLNPVIVTKMFQPFVDAGIRVNTVGTGSVNQKIMQRIADITGGAFIMVEDFSDLQGAMDRVLYSEAQDNLLTMRSGMLRMRTIYTVMRIGFLTILGMLINAVGSMLIYTNDSKSWVVLLRAFAGAVVAAVLMELFAGFYTKNGLLYIGFMMLNMLSFVLISESFRTSGEVFNGTAKDGYDSARKRINTIN